MSHFIEKCRECGTTISQCRCPDLNKTVKYGICAKCKETPPDRAMTRAEVEAIPERTALGWDDIANLKAHTLALHDKLDRAVEFIGKINCNHYYSEDSWYSCPKAEDGCADASQGDECNCGADTVKAGITKILAEIQEEVIDG